MLGFIFGAFQNCGGVEALSDLGGLVACVFAELFALVAAQFGGFFS